MFERESTYHIRKRSICVKTSRSGSLSLDLMSTYSALKLMAVIPVSLLFPLASPLSVSLLLLLLFQHKVTSSDWKLSCSHKHSVWKQFSAQCEAPLRPQLCCHRFVGINWKSQVCETNLGSFAWCCIIIFHSSSKSMITCLAIHYYQVPSFLQKHLDLHELFNY